jgi:hypothetical protein
VTDHPTVLHKAFAEILREVDGRGYKPPFHVAVVSRNGPHALLTFSRAPEGDGFVVTYGHNNDGVE